MNMSEGGDETPGADDCIDSMAKQEELLYDQFEN